MKSRESAEPAPAKGDNAPISVSRLSAYVSSALDAGVPTPVSVVGEISGFRERTHWYFDLKDADAVIGCVMFASNARRAGFVPESGQEVIVKGRVQLYAKSGRLSILVDRIEAVGAGALELAFRKLCAELKEAGYFEDSRKRALPLLPRRIAVVTSRSGAALQDVIDTARRRMAGVEIALVDVRVQGDGAAGEVARAIRWLSDEHAALGVDAILLTRGGGSMEDLWAFNERNVADAIYDCEIPVVAAIGHETDVTVAELVADERGATPTQGIMRLVPDGDALREQVESLSRRMDARLARTLAELRARFGVVLRASPIRRPASVLDPHRRRLQDDVRVLSGGMASVVAAKRLRFERVTGALHRQRPESQHARRAIRLERAISRLESAIRRRLDVDVEPMRWRLVHAMKTELRARDDGVASLERELRAVGPGAVLERGFSATMTNDGRMVRRVGDVSPGTTVVTRVSDGSFSSTVDGAAEVAGESAPTPERPRRKRVSRPSRGNADQMDLFGQDG